MTGLKALFTYDHWANRETLASFLSSSSPPEVAVSRFAHIIAAEFLWYARLSGTAAAMAVWPEPKLDRFSDQLFQLREIWSEFLEKPQPERLISYTNSKGEHFSNSTEDVLMHVVLHSAYHRGQIASDMRAAGFTPAYTDFIHAVRTGALKEDE